MRVLLADHRSRRVSLVARHLRGRGVAVDHAGTDRAALGKATLHPYTVIVLHRELPVGGGDELCRRLAELRMGARLLVLADARVPGDAAEVLALGADDYLAPFDLDELTARLGALARRPEWSRPPVLRRADVELDPARRVASRGASELELGPKEFGVLQTLLEADGAVVSAEAMLARVWDENIDPFSNVLRVVVMTLRRKLGEPEAIETVAGVGYRLR